MYLGWPAHLSRPHFHIQTEEGTLDIVALGQLAEVPDRLKRAGFWPHEVPDLVGLSLKKAFEVLARLAREYPRPWRGGRPDARRWLSVWGHGAAVE